MYKHSDSINRNRPQPGERRTRVGGSHKLPLLRDQVWSALNDATILEQCIKGCNEVKIDESGEYHAEFGFCLGPVKKKLVARLSVEKTAPPEHYRLISVLKTRRMGGARGHASVQLIQLDQSTQLDYDAEIAVNGWFALMGEDVLHAAAGRYMHLFFERFVALVGQT